MKQIALLEYKFMFDPSSTWSHLFEFEKQLTEFFDSKGLEAQIIKAIEGGGATRILYLRKKELVIPEAPNPVGRPETLKGRIKRFSKKNIKAPERDFKRGKFLPRKGYLKK